LSLIVEKKCRVEEKIFVPKESFIPKPKVESSVLLFETHDDFRHIDDTFFLKFIKIGFSEPRKKLIKNLVKGGYEKDNILEFLKKNTLSENTR
jgi:16S rRNA (adenine1518-N6/adenine1519-N6)-dimethyltransferase